MDIATDADDAEPAEMSASDPSRRVKKREERKQRSRSFMERLMGVKNSMVEMEFSSMNNKIEHQRLRKLRKIQDQVETFQSF